MPKNTGSFFRIAQSANKEHAYQILKAKWMQIEENKRSAEAEQAYGAKDDED